MKLRMMKDNNYYEKLEAVFAEWEHCMDLEVALTIVPLSKAIANALLTDVDLLARIAVADAKFKSFLIDRLLELASSKNDNVSSINIERLGKMFYPKRFGNKPDGSREYPLHVIWEEVQSAAS